MESATILTPLHQLKRYSAFCQNPVFPKDQNKKNINTISMHGEEFYQLHIETTAAVAVSEDMVFEALRMHALNIRCF